MIKEREQEPNQLRFRALNELSLEEFVSECSEDKKRLRIRDNVKNGDVYIIRKVLTKTDGEYILKKIINSKIEKSEDHKILDGIKNIYYESNNLKQKESQYSSIDKSWYFFPWNEDNLKITKIIQPIFNNVILLNNKKITDVVHNLPSDGFVQRFHLINYPPNTGQISLHFDPVNICQVNSGIYLSQFGIDYSDGGFYVLNDKKEKIYVDRHVQFGDMVLFYPGLPHGVSTIKAIDSQRKSDGRYFLNMNLIESHHNENRNTAKALLE